MSAFLLLARGTVGLSPPSTVFWGGTWGERRRREQGLSRQTRQWPIVHQGGGGQALTAPTKTAETVCPYSYTEPGCQIGGGMILRMQYSRGREWNSRERLMIKMHHRHHSSTPLAALRFPFLTTNVPLKRAAMVVRKKG